MESPGKQWIAQVFFWGGGGANKGEVASSDSEGTS